MVRLSFNNNKESLSSLSSKKVEKNLNPFKNEDYLQEKECHDINSKLKLQTKDLIGLENCHFVLKKWYESCQEHLGKNLLIIGPTGCGKTTLINLFCEEEKINFLDIRLNDIKTKKDILKEIEYFISYSNNNFFVRNKIKKLILIDNYHTGLNFSLTDISDIKIPIIIISSDSKGSKLSDLKKVCEVYYINEIPISLLKPWITKECNKLLNADQINYILKTCKSDKRLILNLLKFLKDTKTKTLQNIDIFLQSYF
jgi:replication-associated recombination protein RarA